MDQTPKSGNNRSADNPVHIRFLSPDLRQRILEEAFICLAEFGVEVGDSQASALLLDNGAKLKADEKRLLIPADMAQAALKRVPAEFSLYDSNYRQTHHFVKGQTHFEPGSSALKIIDSNSGQMRPPNTADYINYVRLVEQLKYVDGQSTAFIPEDVAVEISDSYRLYLSLKFGTKPVITGTFSAESLAIMHDLQTIIRRDSADLRQYPLTVFTVCPVAPLKLSAPVASTIIDCARHGIPMEIVPMPMTGFISPVTIIGTLAQMAAEIISGIVLVQLVNPGNPVLWGGSPTAFDIRHQTTPMGAMETMLLDCGNNEIGQSQAIPTQAYIALSDAKQLDTQAGLETGMGAVLATMSGINSITGPGMLEFENSFSLEKLLVDNEIAGMCRRLQSGVTDYGNIAVQPLLDEMERDQHLIISDHTLKYLNQEHQFPGAVIDRSPTSKWEAEDRQSLPARARALVEEIITGDEGPSLSREKQQELDRRMASEAQKFDCRLPPQ